MHENICAVVLEKGRGAAFSHAEDGHADALINSGY